MNNILHCFPGGRHKALTMSYDDGRLADVRLVSIFNRWGIRGTFNLNYGLMQGNRELVAPERVAELYAGHEISTHTSHHPSIARCPLCEVAREILEDREGLEKLAGYPVRGHAYPNNSHSPEVRELLQGLGIAYGRVVGSSHGFDLPGKPMEWVPTCHHSDPELMELGRRLAGAQRKPSLDLMYVWGHSYEFDRDGNWSAIEEFCEFMGGREDIWYATNIEIIDYLDVLKRLCFFADCNAVYNPSAASAWVEGRNGTVVEVKGGSIARLDG